MHSTAPDPRQSTHDHEAPSDPGHLPEDGHLRVVEFTDSRKVVDIPPGGGRNRTFLIFVIIFAGIALMATLIFGFGARTGKFPGMVLIVPALLWLLEMALVWLWVRIRFSRFLLLLDENRLVLRRILLGRETTRELPFGGSILAELHRTPFRDSYDSEIYAVEIRGDDEKVVFGTALPRREKEWLVRVINDHIRAVADHTVGVVARCPSCNREFGPQAVPRPGADVRCPQCEASVPGRCVRAVGNETPASLSPGELRAASGLRVLESNGRLRFEVCEPVPFAIRCLTAGVLLVLFLAFAGTAAGLFWWVASKEQIGEVGAVPLISGIAAAALSFIPLSLLVYMAFGRTVVEVSAERLTCRYAVGPVGYTERIRVNNIRDVVVSPDQCGEDRHTLTDHKLCVVRGSRPQNSITLTAGYDLETARAAAGLVAHRLECLRAAHGDT